MKILELVKAYLRDRFRRPVMVGVQLLWSLSALVFIIIAFGGQSLQFGGSAFQSSRLLVPGYLGLVLAYAFTFSIASSIIEDKANGLYRMMRSTRLSKRDYILSKLSTSLIAGAVMSLAVLLLGILMTDVKLLVLPILVVAVLTILAHSGLGIIIGDLLENQSQAQYLMPIVMLVLVFGSPVFYTPEMLPEIVRPLQSIIPLTHSVEAFREIMVQGKDLATIGTELFVLSGFTLISNLIGYARLDY